MDYRLENADRRPSTFAYFRKSTIDNRVWRSTRIPACQWQYWDSRRANVWQFFGFKLLCCQSHVSLLWVLTFMIMNVVLVKKWRNFVRFATFHVNAKKLRRTKSALLCNNLTSFWWHLPLVGASLLHVASWTAFTWHQRTEWHGPAHAARPSAHFVLGWTGPRKSGPGRFLVLGRGGPGRDPSGPGRAAGFGLSCHSVRQWLSITARVWQCPLHHHKDTL